jgi:hypothetical protein
MQLSKFKTFSLFFLPLGIPSALMLVYGLKNVAIFLLGFLALLISFAMALHLSDKQARKNRLKFIQNYKFPAIVTQKFMAENRHLLGAAVEQVEQALKQFFMAYALTKDGGKKPKDGFMMPSRIADELWHHFMLDSANYEKFCKQAYGQMLHHKPGADNGGNKQLRLMKSFHQSLKNTYEYVEKLKEYNAYNAISGIAILFAIDSSLKINNGFYYDLETMNHIALANSASASSSDSGGACGGIFASDTKDSCSSGSSSSDDDGCSGGGCGGGCGD